jgi:hypothetical protein
MCFRARGRLPNLVWGLDSFVEYSRTVTEIGRPGENSPANLNNLAHEKGSKGTRGLPAVHRKNRKREDKFDSRPVTTDVPRN